MNKARRPACIGLHGSEDECMTCDWKRECENMAKNIESAAFRKGTHVRIVGKYKEKKYKPKRVP
jgi:hypothetical protein